LEEGEIRNWPETYPIRGKWGLKGKYTKYFGVGTNRTKEGMGQKLAENQAPATSLSRVSEGTRKAETGGKKGRGEKKKKTPPTGKWK